MSTVDNSTTLKVGVYIQRDSLSYYSVDTVDSEDTVDTVDTANTVDTVDTDTYSTDHKKCDTLFPCFLYQIMVKLESQ